MDDDGMTKGLVIGLMAGAVLGLAAGMLYAPKSGAETRTIIKEKAMEAREKADELVEKVKERVSVMGNGKKAV
jgi:gas vesicle protein